MSKVISFLITISFVFCSSCTKTKDMDLYKNNNLNDSSHVGNLELKNQKEDIFKGILNFDNWYREKYNGIIYWNDKWQMEGYNYAKGVPEKDRINYIKDTIVPEIATCPFFTKKFRKKTLSNANNADPSCLGRILTSSQYGDNIHHLTSISTPIERLIFHFGYLFKTSFSNNDKLREIPYDEALFYHFTMIKLCSSEHAIYRFKRDITYGDENGLGYLIMEMIKSDESWLVDDIYFIHEEELIDDDSEDRILNYFKNKEAYESGKINL